MTKLVPGRTVKRETAATDRRRVILVELYPHYLGLRVKGRREYRTIDWGAVLDLARKLDARVTLAKRGAA
jgi:hypothetical protein